MKTKRLILVGVMILGAAACAPAEIRGQVDPFWLRSWNEAQQSRPSTMTSVARIADEDEPGAPLVILGQVFGPDDKALTTWRLQGWVVTDAEGRFEFRTIRPAPDHLGREGAHIHFTLESNDYGRQWAPTVYFADDPLVLADERRRSEQAGEFGWVPEVETENGVQQVRVAIRLEADPDF